MQYSLSFSFRFYIVPVHHLVKLDERNRRIYCRIHLFGLGGATAHDYGIDLEMNASNPTPNAYHPPIATVDSLLAKFV